MSHFARHRMLGTLVAAFALLVPTWAAQGPRGESVFDAGDPALMPTVHPRLPADLSQLWFAPVTPQRAASPDVIAAIRQVGAGDYAKALPVLSRPASHQGALGNYAMYGMAVSQLQLGRADDARKAFRDLLERKPVGYLAEAAAIGEAEAAEALGSWSTAIGIYERLLKDKLVAPEEVLMRLARAARAGGQSTKANEAYLRVYYEFTFSPSAEAAAAEVARLNLEAPAAGTERYKLELGRAERLFGAKQYNPARTVFTALRPAARGEDRELVDLRIAESNYYLKRQRDAREALRPYTKDATRQAEAIFFYAVASRELGDIAEYTRSVQRLTSEFGTSTWAAEALNNLGTYYILQDADDKADQVFRQLVASHPKGPYADRAAWKVGWLAYRQKQYRDTVTYFEQAAAAFPRSDYRPSWLYWSARAREALGETLAARERYSVVTADYLNSYYGRLAVKRPGVPTPSVSFLVDPRTVRDDASVPDLAAAPGSVATIRALSNAALYDEAFNEVRYAQRVWGDSPALQATQAWISYQQGLAEKGNDRFALLRGSITTMRRAYPQFMAAGGEQLPREILTVIFPIAYWDQIRKYSAANNLDPYLMAALMAQESTFVSDVRSSANAVGLMQLIPGTARRMARKVGLRYSASLLTNPDANIRMGMTYFSDLMKEFGQPHLALAGYNAGENAVRTWLAERGKLPADEFTDDIPYPETQNYVKRIMGTAEDYRRLYSK